MTQLDEAGKLIIDRLKRDFDTKGLNNTREAVNSLSYRVVGNSLLIDGLERVLFLEFGRAPGKFPNVGKIKEWVRTKLGITDEKELNQVAFLIGRKIAEEGTDIFTDRFKGLQIALTLDEVSDLVLKEVVDQKALQIVEGLITTWES